ncbi:MAG: type II secretion system protein [Cellvibrio sp.]|uniref:type II secretion system protein n=1 Tax=Cellvibrio sp. TaxID=1965322 RepID=UPI0031B3343E
MKKTGGFTLLEMVVVLVMMGIVTSLALPGLQKMYDSMAASLARKDLAMAINNLALDVRHGGHSIQLSNYPADISVLPPASVERLADLGMSLQFDAPLFITAGGFCPYERTVKVIKGVQEYQLRLRAPDCRVVSE